MGNKKKLNKPRTKIITDEFVYSSILKNKGYDRKNN
jgi:hypothetical protein